MLNVKGFFDYCVNESCLSPNYDATIKFLYECGYRTIAINQQIDATEAESKQKRKKKGEPSAVPDLVPVPASTRPVRGCEEVKILNRLTIKFANQEQLLKISKSPTYKKYSIISILPLTTEALVYAANNFDADIVSFNPENKFYLRKSRKLYRQLIEKGYYFEIPYSPAIEDRVKRRNILNVSHILHALIKSRNIIVSSCAEHTGQIRGPYDIINLSVLFGLNEHQAKLSITECGRRVFLNSVGRRHGKAVMFIEKEVEVIPLDDSIDVIELNDSDEQEDDTTAPPVKKRKQ